MSTDYDTIEQLRTMYPKKLTGFPWSGIAEAESTGLQSENDELIRVVKEIEENNDKESINIIDFGGGRGTHYQTILQADIEKPINYCIVDLLMNPGNDVVYLKEEQLSTIYKNKLQAIDSETLRTFPNYDVDLFFSRTSLQYSDNLPRLFNLINNDIQPTCVLLQRTSCASQSFVGIQLFADSHSCGYHFLNPDYPAKALSNYVSLYNDMGDTVFNPPLDNVRQVTNLCIRNMLFIRSVSI